MVVETAREGWVRKGDRETERGDYSGRTTELMSTVLLSRYPFLSFPAVLVFASTVAGPPYPTIQFRQAVLLARLAHLMALALFRGDISENLDVPEPELLTISSWIWL